MTNNINDQINDLTNNPQVEQLSNQDLINLNISQQLRDQKEKQHKNNPLLRLILIICLFPFRIIHWLTVLLLIKLPLKFIKWLVKLPFKILISVVIPIIVISLVVVIILIFWIPGYWYNWFS